MLTHPARLLCALLTLYGIALSSRAQAQPTKLNVAYTSTTTNFSIAWLAKLDGIFRKHNLDVELILMQGPSTYLPALLSGNIHILYGGGTAVSRAIAAADPNIVVIGTETRYVPLRLMVAPSIKTAADLKGKKLGVGSRSIIQITRQNDPVLLEKTYKANLQQYDAIQGLPFPWQEGIESMINGFHARFSPTVVKNRDARAYLDPSFVQRAVDRLGLTKK